MTTEINTKRIRIFLGTQTLAGMDEMVATYRAAKTDYDGRNFCGKTRRAELDETFTDNAGVVHKPVIHIPASKIDAIIEGGCSMLPHLSEEELTAQRFQYTLGKVALKEAQNG